MGSLSYGELAGERMKLGLMLNDPEEEQDCFSDNTHNSHYYDGIGIRNVYLGSTADRRQRAERAALADLVAAADPAAGRRSLAANSTPPWRRSARSRPRPKAGFAYDQMLAPGDKTGEALIMGGVDALVTQTASIERAVTALGLGEVAFEGSDSLDSPDAVFQ